MIIPAFNAENEIGEQLAALGRQHSNANFDILVADNGSTDQTRRICEDWSSRLPLRVIEASERKGPNHARNRAAQESTAGLLLFCDADDVVGDRWVSSMCEALKNADAVGGRIVYSALNDSSLLTLRQVEDQTELYQWSKFLPYAITANLGVRRSAFDEVGGFDEQFAAAGDDVDFCWRLQLAGFTLDYEYRAEVHYRLRADDRAAARQRYHRGIAEAHLYAKFRQHGMPRRPFPRALRTLLSVLRRSPSYFSQRPARVKWSYEAATRLGNLAGSVRYRVPYL